LVNPVSNESAGNGCMTHRHHPSLPSKEVCRLHFSSQYS
jgi:hypothetical protein